MKQKTITTAGRWAIQFRDIAKGLLLAVMSATVPPILEVLNSGQLTFNWKVIGTAAISTAIAYVFKKFTEPEKEITVTEK